MAVEEEFRAFHKRRAEQLAEKKAKEEHAAEIRRQQEEKEATDLRKWRIDFYGEQAQKLSQELKIRQGRGWVRQCYKATVGLTSLVANKQAPRKPQD